jgi:hypothetical protein
MLFLQYQKIVFLKQVDDDDDALKEKLANQLVVFRVWGGKLERLAFFLGTLRKKQSQNYLPVSWWKQRNCRQFVRANGQHNRSKIVRKRQIFRIFCRGNQLLKKLIEN